MQDELIIYSNISNKKYVEEMILEGLHVERDLVGTIINEKEIRLAEYLFVLDRDFSEPYFKPPTNDKDPFFIRLWKQGMRTVGLTGMKASFKNLCYNDKTIKPTLRTKLIYDMVYRECYKRYDRIQLLENTSSFLTDYVRECEGLTMEEGLKKLQNEAIPGERFPWLDAFFPRLWNKVYETESKA